MTTCVGECAQAGLKQIAYQWACVLIRPENLNQIPPKFKTRIESIARRPVKVDDEPESLAPCPYCKFEIPEYRLDCPGCKHYLPFCAASGKHMILSEWSSCPKCSMCTNYSEMKKMTEFEPVCPICDAQVAPMSVTIADDVQSEFKAFSELLRDSGPSKEDEEENEEEGDDQ